MRLALLGCNGESLRIIRAIAATSAHRVATIHDAEPYRKVLAELVPQAIWEAHWETLLVSGEVDAVIASCHDDVDAYEDQLRKLAQAAVPIIVTHPLHDSLLAYELEMIREDVDGAIVPFAAGIEHPALAQLAGLIACGEDSAVGRAEQIVFERFLSDRSRRAVFDQLARDVTLSRSLIGDITSVNATGDASQATTILNLAVNLCGADDLFARWSVAPAVEERNATITVVGASGRAAVIVKESSEDWQFKPSSSTQSAEAFGGYHEELAVLERLQETLEHKRPSTWEAICHDLEVAELAERSLRRKKTIEIRRDSQNEEGTFKGLMAAGGCVILMLTFLFLIVFAVVEGFRMPLIDSAALHHDTAPVERSPFLLRIWPVYPFVAFLLLQCFLLVAKRAPSRSKSHE